ncbi:hypothetical protein F1654_09140 [Alkalicaulis satelles]|uniref:Zinc finger/thioredoxin putative domain-containing protein n=1 Tax=Alkalicaulis satelles TaxID=2609175 RepID=A0A5M6ZGP7_9PROT|nr:zinc-ribbon domain-containing protein [Alkalicaulis satelles]KAA5803946.1 hypothetical protein F1654_09140 [Alkalicaulis satelles]
MIVTCPSCDAKYRVEPAALEARGGRVRCASCGHHWQVEAEALTLSEPAEPRPKPAAPEPEPAPSLKDKPAAAVRARAEARRRKARLAAEGAGWAGVAAALVVMLAGAVFLRADIVSAFPHAAGAYAAVGLETHPTGLKVEDLGAMFEDVDGAPSLIVEGVVRNTTARLRRTAPLKAMALDEHGNVLAEWRVVLESTALPGGGSERFRTLMTAPPDAAVRVEVIVEG